MSDDLPILGSQYPDDLLSDPTPYVHTVTGERGSVRVMLETYWSPRPEYRLQLPHATNTALADLRPERNRKVYTGFVDPATFYSDFADRVLTDSAYSDDEKRHASIVVRRLAAAL